MDEVPIPEIKSLDDLDREYKASHASTDPSESKEPLGKEDYLNILLEDFEQAKLQQSDSSDLQSGDLDDLDNVKQKNTGGQFVTRILSNSLVGLSAYTFLLLFLFFIHIYSSTPGAPPQIFLGYSFMVMPTDAMQSEISEGSLIINRRVRPENLREGDDITFLVQNNVVEVRRIIEIPERQHATQELAFRTAGTDNLFPDAEPVHPVNVIGRVAFSSFTLGRIMTFLSNNFIYVVIFAILAALGIVILRAWFSPEKKLEKWKNWLRKRLVFR